MKLRIRGDSIRLRLTQAEVRAVGEGETVEESTAFGPNQRFNFAIKSGDQLGASFSNGSIEVVLPRDVARSWAASDRVGIEAEQDAGDGRVLRILVEKDFACLKPRDGEDDADAFPHPNPKAC